jgi:hypothetical protein
MARILPWARKLHHGLHGFGQGHDRAVESACGPVDLVEVDDIRLQPLQRGFTGVDHLLLLQMGGKHLGHQHHAIAHGS